MPYLDQHFLKNSYILKNIAASISLTNKDTLVEIGPGKGALTTYLIKRDFSELILVEKDVSLKPYLEKFKVTDSIKIVFESILDNIEKYPHAKFVGNIPYAITEPLYKKFLECEVEEAVVLHGKDFYVTCTQRTNSKWYYYVNAYYCIDLIEEVSGEEFEPPTKVTSVAVHLKKKHNPSIKEKFWQEFFKKETRALKNTLIFSLIDSLNISKKEAKSMLESFIDPILTKKTSQLSNQEFLRVVEFVEQHVMK